jgi:hypothetical protein
VSKGWPSKKEFTIIAKKKCYKKGKKDAPPPKKVGGVNGRLPTEADDEEEGIVHEEEEEEEEEEENDNLRLPKPNPLSSTVTQALVTGSFKRNERSKKTKDVSHLCEADNAFIGVIGPGDLSNLSCNDFASAAIILRLDTKNKNISFSLKKK